MAWHIKDRIRAIFDKEFAFRKNLKCSDCAHASPREVWCYQGLMDEDGFVHGGSNFGFPERLREKGMSCGPYAKEFVSKQVFYRQRRRLKEGDDGVAYRE